MKNAGLVVVTKVCNSRKSKDHGCDQAISLISAPWDRIHLAAEELKLMVPLASRREVDGELEVGPRTEFFCATGTCASASVPKSSTCKLGCGAGGSSIISKCMLCCRCFAVPIPSLLQTVPADAREICGLPEPLPKRKGHRSYSTEFRPCRSWGYNGCPQTTAAYGCRYRYR